MLAPTSTVFSWLAYRIRSCAELELELFALRHQVAALNRQRPDSLRLCSLDRLTVGVVLPLVAALSRKPGADEARHRGPMAPPRLSAVLAFALAIWEIHAAPAAPAVADLGIAEIP